MNNQQGHDLITSLVIALLLLGIGFAFVKRTGIADEIKRTLQEISRKSD